MIFDTIVELSISKKNLVRIFTRWCRGWITSAPCLSPPHPSNLFGRRDKGAGKTRDYRNIITLQNPRARKLRGDEMHVAKNLVKRIFSTFHPSDPITPHPSPGVINPKSRNVCHHRSRGESAPYSHHTLAQQLYTSEKGSIFGSVRHRIFIGNFYLSR